MKNLPQVKIGIVVGSTDWMPEDLAVECRKRIVAKYIDRYGEDSIYECQVCINDNELNAKRALKEIAKAECNAVCLIYANYGPESAGTMFANEFDGPVMMCALKEEGNAPYARERRDAISGFINACYALGLRRTDNVFLPSKPVGTEAECVDLIYHFLPIARTVLGVHGLKVISIGPRPTSYLASNAPNYLLYDIGVEVDECSELEIFGSYQKHENDRRIQAVVDSMRQEVGESTAGSKLESMARYELTLEDWIRTHKGNRKYVAMTSTCWPAFPLNFEFVPCYVNSRITGKGIPVACEVDVFGAVSEYIGQCITEQCVTLLNINNTIPKEVYEQQIKGQCFDGKQYEADDLFLGYHCGVTCSQNLESCKLDYHFVNRQLIGEEKSEGTIQGQMKPGKVTIFRLQGTREGTLRAYVAQGQILPVQMDTYGGIGVIAIPQMARFLRNVILEKNFPNHTVVLYGHLAEELSDALRLLGVLEVEYNHPENVPYENENFFGTRKDWY